MPILQLLVVPALALLVVVASPAAQAPAHRQLSVPYSQFTLPNGLTVILHEDHSVPVVTVNVWYRVGSADERQGRTGLAHLFEHLMFEGSAHLPEGQFEQLTEGAGGDSNASTSSDWTNYYIDVPSNALDLALFIESDRMGYLLDTMSDALVDGQRDVVRNERRERYENAPYGMSWLRLAELMYPPSHPYHWPIVGYMDDLAAASADDMRAFFRAYYTPANASLVVAGDIDPVATRRRIEYWFSDVPAGVRPARVVPPPAVLDGVVRETMTDRVQLPRLYLAWHTPPLYAPGDAELDVLGAVLTDGRTSRLTRRLVYELQIAQTVSAYQYSGRLGSMFTIVATAQPSDDSPTAVLNRIRSIVDEELDRLEREPPAPEELQRVINRTEADFFDRMTRVGGFGGKADLLNAYFVATGNPDYFEEDLARYQALAPNDITAAARRWLPPDARLELSVVPEDK